MRPALLALLLALPAAACDWWDATGYSFGELDARELSLARSRWAQADVRDYRYRLRVTCACDADLQRTVEIEVRGRSPVSVTYVSDGSPADPLLFRDFDTVDDLFEIIEGAIVQDAWVAALYEDYYWLGYPESVIIDYDEFRTDDELEFLMPTDLEILD
jgi:hypothetical protein